MDLTQLANLGEFIGGVAVLGTLIYLVIQVRQGNANMRVASRQTLLDTMYNYTFQIGRDEDLTRITREGLTDFESLSDADKTRYTLTQSRFVGNLHNGILLNRQGILDQDTLDNITGYLASAIRCKGGAAWWSTVPVSAEVRDYMDRFVERHGDAIVPLNQSAAYMSAPVARPKGNSPHKLAEAGIEVLLVRCPPDL